MVFWCFPTFEGDKQELLRPKNVILSDLLFRGSNKLPRAALLSSHSLLFLPTEKSRILTLVEVTMKQNCMSAHEKHTLLLLMILQHVWAGGGGCGAV